MQSHGIIVGDIVVLQTELEFLPYRVNELELIFWLLTSRQIITREKGY